MEHTKRFETIVNSNEEVEILKSFLYENSTNSYNFNYQNKDVHSFTCFLNNPLHAVCTQDTNQSYNGDNDVNSKELLVTDGNSNEDGLLLSTRNNCLYPSILHTYNTLSGTSTSANNSIFDEVADSILLTGGNMISKYFLHVDTI